MANLVPIQVQQCLESLATREQKVKLPKTPGGGGLPYETDGDARRLA